MKLHITFLFLLTAAQTTEKQMPGHLRYCPKLKLRGCVNARAILRKRNSK